MQNTALQTSEHRTPTFNSMSILVVDDESFNVEILEEILGDAGYSQVHSTTDPRQVMALCKQQPPDLILLDLQMPHLDGFEIMQRLKSVDRLRHIPTLVITAQSSHDYRMRALNAGAKDFITKPFDTGEVLTRIHNLLETRQLHIDLQHQNEELARVNNTMSELVSIVSHELRTPLTSIKSFVEILRDEGDNLDEESKKKFLTIINNESDRLNRLISNLLDLQKISSGKMTWKTEFVDLVQTVNDTVEFFTPAFADKQLHIQFSSTLDQAPVLTDADKIRQVISNLLSNALKFTSKGGVDVTLDATSQWAIVLLLSNDVQTVEALGSIIEHLGGTVLHYTSQIQALDYLNTCGGHIDLMLLDIADNKHIGSGLLKQLRSQYPGLPLITLTDGDNPAKTEGTELSQNSSMKKPIDPLQARDAIELQIINAIGISPATRMIDVAIRDSGAGIPCGDLNKVFERFHQVDTSQTREQRGTGLGLTISQEIIQHYYGRIWVESELDKGSTFHFILPEMLQEKKKLGEILIEKGLVTEEQLNAALKDQS